MATPLTRAHIRDTIRRTYLAIIPPIDYASPDTGQPGECPSNRPDPSNALLNECLRLAVSDLNLYCDFTSNEELTLDVAAQDSDSTGSLLVNYLSLAGTSSVNEIYRVTWTQESLAPKLLTGRTWQQLDFTRQPDSANPSTPEYWFLLGDKIGLFPAPDTAGVLTLWAGTSPDSPATDQDTIRNVPADFHEAFYLEAAMRFWRGGRSQDAEAQANLVVNLPEAKMWRQRLLEWKYTRERNNRRPPLVVSHRRGADTRRIR